MLTTHGICKDCNKILSRKDATRCKLCSLKFHRGKNHPSWKGGKPECIDCGKQLGNYGRVRCRNCNKKYQTGKNASNYKGVKYVCKDCGCKLANIYAVRCQHCAKLGRRNAQFGILPSHKKRIKYNKKIFRSSWEANFAKWLNLSEIKWEYEPKSFDLGNTTYTPDFYLPEFNCYIEIKGYWYKKQRQKFHKFKQKYNFRIIVLQKLDLLTLGIL